MKDNWDKFVIISGALQMVAWIILLVTLVVLVSSCSPVAHSITPVTESHSQITASQYDDAEYHFAGAGNMMPMSIELQSEADAEADAECQRILNRRDTASAVVLGLVGLTGAGGLATIIPKDATDAERKGWDLGLGVTTLAAATTATILGALVRSWSAEYERECQTETPEPAEHLASDEVEQEGTDDAGGSER